MSKITRTIQEIVHVPVGVFANYNEIADFIDAEIAKELPWGDKEVIKIDSVSIVYGDEQVKFPFAHSGDEFKGFLHRREQFIRMK